MTLQTWTGVLAAALLSGSAGWVLRGPGAAVPGPTSSIPAEAVEPRANPGLSLLAYPVMSEPEGVTLNADGSVSVHVERRAAAWVLTELCRKRPRLPACSDMAELADAPAAAGSTPR